MPERCDDLLKTEPIRRTHAVRRQPQAQRSASRSFSMASISAFMASPHGLSSLGRRAAAAAVKRRDHRRRQVIVAVMIVSRDVCGGRGRSGIAQRFTRERTALRRQPVCMPGRAAGDVAFLPAIFEKTLFAEAHQQRVERARFEAGELGQLVTVLPRCR